MAPRANWRGFLAVGELSCAVGLYTAASTSDRIAFHTLNRATGNRVRRQFIDEDTGKPVETDDQVKGYEVADGRYIQLEPEEIAAAIPDSDKTLRIETFLACSDIDTVYFDRPYYLLPSDDAADEAFAVLREGLRATKTAALARTLLFRRLRTLLIRAHDQGMIATTLHFDYEVRSAEATFREIPARKIQREMLDLAQHIIATKTGTFDPAAFDDRYEAAVAELVKAKVEGRTIKPRKRVEPKVVDLMEALRASAGKDGGAKEKAAKQKAAEDGAGKSAPKRRAAPAKKGKGRTPLRKAS